MFTNNPFGVYASLYHFLGHESQRLLRYIPINSQIQVREYLKTGQTQVFKNLRQVTTGLAFNWVTSQFNLALFQLRFSLVQFSQSLGFLFYFEGFPQVYSCHSLQIHDFLRNLEQMAKVLQIPEHLVPSNVKHHLAYFYGLFVFIKQVFSTN